MDGRNESAGGDTVTGAVGDWGALFAVGLLGAAVFVLFVRAMFEPERPQINIAVFLNVQPPEPPKQHAPMLAGREWTEQQWLEWACPFPEADASAAPGVRVEHGARPGRAALVDGATTIVRR
jgi:hypothetical protein